MDDPNVIPDLQGIDRPIGVSGLVATAISGILLYLTILRKRKPRPIRRGLAKSVSTSNSAGPFLRSRLRRVFLRKRRQLAEIAFAERADFDDGLRTLGAVFFPAVDFESAFDIDAVALLQ